MDPVAGAFDVDHLGGVEVGKPAAAHVRVELIAHEPGQARPLVTQRLEERWRVLLNNVVQHRVFGTMAGVLTFGLGAGRPLLNMRMHGPIAAHRLARDMGPRSPMSSVTHSACVSPAPPGLSGSRLWAVTGEVRKLATAADGKVVPTQSAELRSPQARR